MLSEKQILRIRKTFNGTNQRIIFKILGDRNRYRIFEMLGKHPELTVGEVATILKISIPLSSQHLKILVDGDLLEKEKRGQKVFYRLRVDNKLAQSIIHEII